MGKKCTWCLLGNCIHSGSHYQDGTDPHPAVRRISGTLLCWDCLKIRAWAATSSASATSQAATMNTANAIHVTGHSDNVGR